MMGYSEAQVSAKAWKGRPRRWWRRPVRKPEAMTGERLVSWVHRMAGRYPGQVKVH